MVGRGPPEERSPAELLSFGIVNLDKPPGPSAHQVADWIQTFTRASIDERIEKTTSSADSSPTGTSPSVERVAHAGTLDPKVTGSLPMLLGDATRLAQVFDESIKEYVVVLELHGPAPSDFDDIVAEFEGEIYQKPPRKSAVKRAIRVREIYELEILEREQRRALIRVRCDAGTYIRKLCHDLGLALGVGAHMGDLRRTSTGQFRDTELVSMEDFVDTLAFWVEDGDESLVRTVVRPAERALVELPRVYIAPNAATEVAHGAPVYAPGILGVEPAEVGEREAAQNGLVSCYTPDGAAVCLGRLVGDPEADSGTVVELVRVLV